MSEILTKADSTNHLPQKGDLSDSHSGSAVMESHTEHAAEGPHISIAPDKLGEFMGLPITNTLVTGLIVTIFLLIVGYKVGKKVTSGVPSGVQNFFEMIFEGILGFIEDVLEDRKMALKFFPLLATLFLFIWVSNWIEFIPGVGSIEYHGHHLLRGVNTDLNVTIALALIAFFTIEISGIRTLGFFSYMHRFFNISGKNIGERILNFFIGIIELVSELARLVAFSFRLFGNIFAGAVLIAVTTYFLPAVAPVPLMMFELFVGFIQAAVFALLTLFFIKIAITKPEH